ncbi:MAG: PSD1 domain-containing protein [Verrucomicrobia bacterium]|nr:PSD1 domain-containing protein [Verrucomicrobiota bacterium]
MALALALVWALGAVGVTSVTGGSAPPEPDAAQIEFFENKIRPLLADSCYPCHSARAEKVKGGLRLDTRDALRQGGASGTPVLPGQPAESLLVQVLRGTAKDVESMPPKDHGGPLSEESIAAVEAWIRMGAPDPREGPAVATPPARSHWAFARPVDPPVPAPSRFASPAARYNAVDDFIQARLVEKGLAPASPADRRTLLRRITFDLTGLPPTPEEMSAFLRDDSPGAYEAVVDRLLAAPEYGERWGRHWLDVARYADSKGYVFEQERRFSHSFTYRDWVVNALNRDLPYDEFLLQQIAGDRLATPENPWPMAAQGFLTLGRRFLDNTPDIIDDRIDVVFRGTQGLTVSCARCHDHKYDPIPTADYYSLYGVFNSSHEPAERPLLGPNPDPRRAADYEAELARRQKELADFRAERTAEIGRKLRERVGDYLLAAQDSLGLDWTNLEGLARVRSLDPGLVAAWKSQLEKWRATPTPAFRPWFAFAALATNEFAVRAPEIATRLTNAPPDAPQNPRVAAALAARPPASMQELATRYGELILAADAAWASELEASRTAGRPAPEALQDPAGEELRQLLYGPESPITAATRDVDRFFDTPTGQKLRGLKRKVDELDATHPGAPLRAMALVDNDKPSEPVVFKRGNPGNHGPAVPRQFLALVSGAQRTPFTDGSGRLELARAIASRDNPLTARVMVNRVWQRHFGSPLVGTPSDFGVRCDPPSHPELLDHLAVWFMDHGWSLKQLHRYLVLSATYRQSSDPGPDAAAREAFARCETVDPANTLWWRMNRKRADFEALRDTLLAVSGRLDPSLGGQPVPMYEEPGSARRTLYGFIDRQNLPGILRAFDFASPDSTSPMRFQTTTPQQALFLMNSPFMAERARDFAGRPDLAAAAPAARIERMYALAFQRPPTAEERTLALAFVGQTPGAPPEPAPASTWSYGTGLWNPDSGRVEQWRALPTFSGEQWQWETKVPSSTGQWTLLNRDGGHPGSSASNAAIRRWTAPFTGRIRISGALKQEAEAGDGVLGRVISSRTGSLGTWEVHHGRRSTEVETLEVQTGDALDFVVEPRADENSDSFEWRVDLTRLDPAPVGAAASWNSRRDFSGPRPTVPPLDAWQEFAQVLLSANEFVFVD